MKMGWREMVATATLGGPSFGFGPAILPASFPIFRTNSRTDLGARTVRQARLLVPLISADS